MKRASANHGHDHATHPPKALISLNEALRMCMDLARPIVRTETVSLHDSLRRVMAKDVRSTIDVPSADRSAMDGYAVVARETSRARKSRPAVLRLQEVVFAGGVPTNRVANGRCTQVATGAMLPRGADAVVMVEVTEREGDRVRVYRPAHAGENVSKKGSDIPKGSFVVAAGESLAPAKVGALAAIGLDRALVYAKPRVALLTTGEEIVPPGGPIRPGQVYDINATTMPCVVQENGGEPVIHGRIPDGIEELQEALAHAAREDLVVFSGGSSVGERDLLIHALRSLGDILFHGIAMKPGRPTLLGRVEGTPVLGMPGNPTSCLNNGYILLAPMLRRMARLLPALERVIEVPLAKRITSPLGRVEFHTVRIVDGRAVPAYKESGAITSMAHADGYIEIPADVGLVEKGERVRVTLF